MSYSEYEAPSIRSLENDNIRTIIEHIGNVGARYHTEIYLVGGFVRDLARMKGSEDLDFVIIGEPKDFANKLITTKQNSLLFEIVKEHPTFGTMTLSATLDNGFSLKIDLCTARTETYPNPAELPVVTAAPTIQADIKRRDFSINTMALQISPQF